MGEKIAMAQFMEKIATDFFAFAPHPLFFYTPIIQILIPPPIGTLPATSNSHANIASPTSTYRANLHNSP